MHPNYQLDLAHSIANERIREARRERLLHQHGDDGQPGIAARFRSMVKGATFTVRIFGVPQTPAGAPSR